MEAGNGLGPRVGARLAQRVVVEEALCVLLACLQHKQRPARPAPRARAASPPAARLPPQGFHPPQGPDASTAAADAADAADAYARSRRPSAGAGGARPRARRASGGAPLARRGKGREKRCQEASRSAGGRRRSMCRAGVRRPRQPMRSSGGIRLAPRARAAGRPPSTRTAARACHAAASRAASRARAADLSTATGSSSSPSSPANAEHVSDPHGRCATAQIPPTLAPRRNNYKPRAQVHTGISAMRAPAILDTITWSP